MTFVELPVVPIYWHFPGTIKGYSQIWLIMKLACTLPPLHTV